MLCIWWRRQIYYSPLCRAARAAEKWHTSPSESFFSDGRKIATYLPRSEFTSLYILHWNISSIDSDSARASDAPPLVAREREREREGGLSVVLNLGAFLPCKMRSVNNCDNHTMNHVLGPLYNYTHSHTHRKPDRICSWNFQYFDHRACEHKGHLAHSGTKNEA